MSYCRASSDDWQSDVYVFESKTGFHISVANHHTEWLVPLPPFVDPSDYDADMKRDKEVMKLLYTPGTTREVQVDPRYDGASIDCQTVSETLAWLLRLRELGYWIPQDAINRLKDEEADGYELLPVE